MKSSAKYLFVLVSVLACVAFAQQPSKDSAGQTKPAAATDSHRLPTLLFREEVKKGVPNKGEHALTQADLVNQNLELQTYGFKAGIMVNDQAPPLAPEEVTFFWTGLCEANCAVALRDKNNYLDLSGLAKLRWSTKQNGFHLLRPIVELADGTWLVGDHTEGYTADWHETEFMFADVRWRTLDVTKVVEAGGKVRGLDFNGWVVNPDLSKVDAVGFTDLMAGSGHGGGGSSRVRWIEVYGNPVPRPAQAQ